jgi:hypothetical protein
MPRTAFNAERSMGRSIELRVAAIDVIACGTDLLLIDRFIRCLPGISNYRRTIPGDGRDDLDRRGAPQKCGGTIISPPAVPAPRGRFASNNRAAALLRLRCGP